MKVFNKNSKKLRYGGVSAALTALIVVVVIIVNLCFSALSSRYGWYADMTPDKLYTISDACMDLLRNGDEVFDSESPIKMVDKIRAENKAANEAAGLTKGDAGYLDEDVTINIIFCDYKDNVRDNATQRYVHDSAEEIYIEFPDYFELKYVDIARNPSAVSKYKVSSTSKIYPTDVIIEFGSEYRICDISSFYRFNDGESTPWAYDGERKLAGAILGVTRAESPIACVTMNHGERENTALKTTLEDAGYKVQNIDLATEDIPENCRLIVIFDPNADFKVNDGISEIDEIKKLDEFLDETNSMMVFMSPDSPVLHNLEEYLTEWGIEFDRATSDNYPYLIKDSTQAISVDGYTIIGDYFEYGLGGAFTSEMRNVKMPKNVIFPRAMSISYSDKYTLTHYQSDNDALEEQYAALTGTTIENKESFEYATYNSVTITRTIYDMFVTTDKAEAYVNGNLHATAKDHPFKLMTVSMEQRITQDANYADYTEENSYVIACGSTEFASESLLYSSSYGNGDLLLSACRAIGREPVPVGISLKPFADYTIDNITTAEATQYTVVLTVLPLLIASVTGGIVLIRRKNR